MNDLRQTILHKIQSGEVTMRPRWHFVLQSVLILLGVIISVLGLVYLVSFIVFVLVGTGVIFVPMFGLHGLVEFLLSAPWFLIVLAIAFAVVLEYLVSHYSFSYRRPLLYSVCGIVGVTVLGAVLVSYSDLHYAAMERAKESRLPFVGAVYREYGLHPYKSVHVGMVSATTSGGFVLRARTGEEYRVVIGSALVIEPKLLRPGERVLILGELEDDEIEAFGVMPYGSRDIRAKHFVPVPLAPAPL